jgi:bleomycin hydrolase
MKILITSLICCFVLSFTSFAQEKEDQGYKFKTQVELKYTPVKDQYRSGTCWSYATISFIESELLRLNKGIFDLSEMFYVHDAYRTKASKYIRYHGNYNFGPGGQAHDVFNSIKKYGIVTQQEYSGIPLENDNKPDHGEMDAVLSGFLKSLSEYRTSKLSSQWQLAFNAVLEAYMGKLPSSENNSINELYGIDPNDYVEITSFTHHPFYSQFVLEIPDNWSGNTYYNVPIDELIEIVHYSLDKGYTVCWDGDVSDKGFSHSNSIAISPVLQPISDDGTEMAKWEKMTDKEKNEIIYNFKNVRSERTITQQMRQDAFDNYQSTDDHLMHIIGKAIDQNGKSYFITKNSWSDKSNSTGGLLNISEAYARLNTIAILVHKQAIPSDIREKLNL